MADDTPKPNTTLPGKEQPVERRMMLAFALVGLVLMLSQFLFKPANQGPKQQTPARVEQAKAPAGTPAPSKSSVPEPTSTRAQSQLLPPTSNSRPWTRKCSTSCFRTRAASRKSWQLKAYKDSQGKPLELVNEKAAEKTWYPLAFLYDNQKPSTDPNFAYMVATVTDGGLGVGFEFSNGRTRAVKSLRFGPDSYLFDVTSELVRKQRRNSAHACMARRVRRSHCVCSGRQHENAVLRLRRTSSSSRIRRWPRTVRDRVGPVLIRGNRR